MMQKKLQALLTLLIFLFTCPAVFSQLLMVSTDRYSYASGDAVFIKITDSGSFSEKAYNYTTFIHLLSSDNQCIKTDILKMNQGFASGYVLIPDSLATGFYSITASIDQSADMAASCRLFVSNRFGKNENLAPQPILPTTGFTSKNTEGMEIKMLPEQPKTRKKVTLQFTTNTTDSLFGSLAVKRFSKTEEELEEINQQSLSYCIVYQKNQRKNIQNDGLKIEGKALHHQTWQPVSNAVVFLSFRDSVLRLKYCITDSEGVFRFYLNDYYGNQTACFSAFTYPSLEPIGNVFFEFSQNNNLNFRVQGLVTKGFAIDTLQVQKALIGKAYQQNLICEDSIPLRDTFLYEHHFITGLLTDKVFIDDYILLPDFEQIAIEILPFIRYKKSDNKFNFSVIDGKNGLVRKQPLVLVDGIPLVENNLLFDWGSTRIKRVDVKSQPRFYGDLLFENGIVLIWTKDQKFWQQNSSSFFQPVEFSFYQKPVSYSFPEYSNPVNSEIPDFRPVLYWNPDVCLLKNNANSITFYTSDEKGVFECVFKGVTQTGEPVEIKKLFNVD